VNNKFSFRDLHIYKSGAKNGKTILFLHGAGSNHTMWLNHIQALESRFNCFVPDLPGHGKSNHVAWTSIGYIGDELAKLIKSKFDKKINLVGFSLGGSLSFYLLENYPELFERVLIDGTSAYPLKGSSFLVMALKMISPFVKFDFILNGMVKSIEIPENEIKSFKENIKLANRKVFIKSMIHANQYKLKNKEYAKTIPVLYASGQKESATMHHSHIELSNIKNESTCVQYPEKGHAWMVSDKDTHVSMVFNWINKMDSIPKKLKTIS